MKQAAPSIFFAALIVIPGISLVNDSVAKAADNLPYGTRTQPYSAFDTSARGDVRTVGMGGATVGLGDSFLAATNNPSGLAMVMNGGDTNITANTVHDSNLQNYNYGINTSSIGFALNPYPWAFSLGDVPTSRQNADYFMPGAATGGFAGQPATLMTQAHEFRFAFAHLLFNDKVSLGGSVNLGRAEEQATAVDGSVLALNDDRHATAVGATLGAIVLLPDRLLLGASYTTAMHYHFSGPSAYFPGFFQDMRSPEHGDLALGWVPNRFLRGDLGFSVFGETAGAALLSDQQHLIGSTVTFQPKLGVAYIFMDFQHAQGTVFGGSYFEYSRIDAEAGRFHRTGGAEVKFSLATIGVGFDNAPRYQNFLFSVGIDAGLVLEFLNLMPHPWHPDHRGLLPNPFFHSDEGLARPLVANYRPEGPEINPIEIILDLPKNAKTELKKLEKSYGDEQKERKEKRDDEDGAHPAKAPGQDQDEPQP